MSGQFLRNSTALRLLRTHTISDIRDPTTLKTIHSHLKHQPPLVPNSKPYFGFSNLFKRSRECNGFAPHPPPPASRVINPFFPSSLAATTTSSFGKIGVITWYLGVLKARPILTKSVTSALIYAAADFSSQTLAKPFSEPYDLVRMSRMAGYGMLVLGPSLHYWFNFMSKLLPKRDFITTVKKILMGQTLYGPVMTVVFFSSNAFLQGENGGEIMARLKRDLVPTFINGAMYWPLCDFITFKFIPVQLQPLVSNSFSYLWTVYMTYMASLEKPEAASLTYMAGLEPEAAS